MATPPTTPPSTSPPSTTVLTGAGGGRTVHPGAVLATVCLCQVMVVLDNSVVNVALPSIARDLGFTPGELSWVVNAYTLVFGGLLLLGGRIADLVGLRRALFAGLALFGIAAVLGGLSQAPWQLIAARAAMGLAAAVLSPVSLTVIMVTFTEGTQRHRAIGLWAMMSAAGAAVGVLLGGVLTDLLDWRWVFFVNVPIIAVALPLALRSVFDPRPPAHRRLDVLGAVLGTGAVTSLVFAMVRASEHGWGSTGTVVGLAVAVVAGVAFVGWERWGSPQPLVRLGVLAIRSVWVANLVVVFVGAATIAGFYFASLFLQNVLEYTPIQAGAAFLPFCFGTVLGARLSSLSVSRFGPRLTLTAGLVLGTVGMVLFSRLTADSTFLVGFLPPSVVASIGIGLCLVANTSLGTSGVEQHEAGLVSGLLNTSRQCGGSIGLAALSTAAVAATRGQGAAASPRAIVAGYDRAYLITAVFLLAAAVVTALFAPSRSTARD